MTKESLRIVYMGTPDFAVETLDGQTLHNELGILFYLLQCKHFSLFFSFLIFALPLRVAGPIVGEEMIPAVVE